MWHSVESRTPFADDIDLIEHTFRQAGSYKIHNGYNKYLLREASQSFMPPQIKTRKDKMGFVTPNNQWITEIKNDVKHLFDNNQLKDYINIDLLKKEYDQFFSPKGNIDTGRIFKFIAFAQWVKVFKL